MRPIAVLHAPGMRISTPPSDALSYRELPTLNPHARSPFVNAMLRYWTGREKWSVINGTGRDHVQGSQIRVEQAEIPFFATTNALRGRSSHAILLTLLSNIETAYCPLEARSRSPLRDLIERALLLRQKMGCSPEGSKWEIQDFGREILHGTVPGRCAGEDLQLILNRHTQPVHFALRELDPRSWIQMHRFYREDRRFTTDKEPFESNWVREIKLPSRSICVLTRKFKPGPPTCM